MIDLLGAKNFLITGRPGIGKTTAVLRVSEALKRLGVKVGGMISREERERGIRVGFILEDLMTGERGYLAKVGAGSGPRVGKYTVLIDDLERVGVGAIERALREADVIIIDEIGPMELYSGKFVDATARALNSPKPVVATIHVKAKRYPAARDILSRGDVKVYYLTLENRSRVPLEIVNALKGLLALNY